MTRDEAIELLKSGPQGVEKWNEWRKKYEPLPDLSDIDLRGAYLREADLSEVSLEQANFSGADLSEADFSHANLDLARLHATNLSAADLDSARFQAALLSHADLSKADVSDVDFDDAHLFAANLSGAEISGAIFRGTFLDKADFTHAQCQSSVFSNVDLARTMGLETVHHLGPSSIGIDTIYRSGGKIPEEFLRGCGVPDEFIRYIPSLIGSMSAVQFYSCFISYSHKDEEFCQRLYSRLRDEHLRVWYAPEDMKGGKKLIDQIDSAIRLHDKLLLVLSEKSMKSKWVETEIYKAIQREKRENRRVLFPIGLCSFEAIRDWQCFDADSGKDMAREIREYFVPDFSNWKDHDSFEQAFARLLKDLRATEASVR